LGRSAVSGAAGFASRLWDFTRWLGGAPLDTVSPTDVLAHLPFTLELAIAALATSLALAIVAVALERSFPQLRLVRWFGRILNGVSVFPAIIIGFVVCIVYSVYLAPGQSFVGPAKTVSESTLMLVTILILALGNGVFQDLKESLNQEISRCNEMDYVFAARARGESTLWYVLRATAVPLLARLFRKIPVFIGAVIPFEFLFDFWGAGHYAWSYIKRWLTTSDGTLFPLIILVAFLAIVIAMFNLAGDLLRMVIDPRQREGAHHGH
jgi:ABC-type dipeptide/oligopeptide/nickel transport system permease component